MGFTHGFAGLLRVSPALFPLLPADTQCQRGAIETRGVRAPLSHPDLPHGEARNDTILQTPIGSSDALLTAQRDACRARGMRRLL